MKTLTVKTEKPYDVVIGSGILGGVGERAAELFPGSRAVLVTDENVEPLYAKCVMDSFRRAGIDAVKFVFYPGEASKSIDVLTELLEYMARQEITRKDFVAALGGGVVGDLAGFAASVYLRGIPYIQIPTTLLAAVDASIGGKTGVNLEEGKNLAGAFHQPSLVWSDYKTHKTMNWDYYADGIAEVVKYGVLRGGELFRRLEKGEFEEYEEEIIVSCVEIKSDLVAGDEKDFGRRRYLNLGHTVGHAIEARSGYAVPHGRAVACGMVKMAQLAAGKGLAAFDTEERIQKTLACYSIPSVCPYPVQELLPYIRSDKKNAGDRLTLIIPADIGRCRMADLPLEELESFFK